MTGNCNSRRCLKIASGDIKRVLNFHSTCFKSCHLDSHSMSYTCLLFVKYSERCRLTDGNSMEI
ncbi:hypothetical protein MPTK2_7g10780 [Marchantia polymorpha subsp. ruderalis]